MKKYSTRLFFLVVVVIGLAAQPATAFLGLNHKSEPKNLFPHAVDHNRYPTMVIRGGVLARDFGGSWTLSGLPLVLTHLEDKQHQDLPRGMAEGNQAFVMGQLRDGVLMVHYISILSSDQTIKRGTYYERRIAGEPKLAPANLPR